MRRQIKKEIREIFNTGIWIFSMTIWGLIFMTSENIWKEVSFIATGISYTMFVVSVTMIITKRRY